MLPKYTPIKAYLSQFAKVDEKYWLSMEEKLANFFLPAGQWYSKEGDYTKTIGFLKKGVLRIYYLDEEGKEWNKAFLEAPQIVLANVNYQEKAHTNIAAITDCEIAQVPLDFYIDALKKYPNLSIIQTKLITNLLERKSQREIELLSLTTKERYLKFSLTFPHLLEVIPQYHLASYLGITPTQLSRIKLSCSNQQM